MSRNRISVFIASFLVIGFFMFAVPEQGYSQEIEIGCCQFNLDNPQAEPRCFNSGGKCPPSRPPNISDGFFPGEECVKEIGICTGFEKNVPTLSEWGLLAMASVLGIVGFVVLRRRMVTA